MAQQDPTGTGSASLPGTNEEPPLRVVHGAVRADAHAQAHADQPKQGLRKATDATSRQAEAARTGRTMIIRRLYAHVTRKRARGAFLLALLSVLIYALIPTLSLGSAISDPTRQFLLILTGVAATALFLPELSSDLWSISRADVRRLIPDERRRALMQELVAAESSDMEWDQIIYDQAISPLLEASRSPWLVVKNMLYNVQVHLNNTRVVNDHPLSFHSVETLSNREQILPPLASEGYYWISVARTEKALETEFGESGCLLRELVPIDGPGDAELDGDAWRDAVAETCQVRVTINGQNQVVTPDIEVSNPEIFRWGFRPEYPEVGQRVPVQIAFDFPMSVRRDWFPVYFSGYYCQGATVVTMKVYNLKFPSLRCEQFFAHGINAQSGPSEPSRVEGALAQQITFSTGRDSLLWPGSGVSFDWHHCVSRSA